MLPDQLGHTVIDIILALSFGISVLVVRKA